MRDKKSSQSKFIFSSLNFPFWTFSPICGQCHPFILQTLLIIYGMEGMVPGAKDMNIY